MELITVPSPESRTVVDSKRWERCRRILSTNAKPEHMTIRMSSVSACDPFASRQSSACRTPDRFGHDKRNYISTLQRLINAVRVQYLCISICALESASDISK